MAGGVRQVDRDELIWLLTYGLGQLPRSVVALMNDSRSEQNRKGRFFAAQALAGQLGRLEIMSDAPPPPPMRFADIEGGSGVPVIDG